MYTKFSHCKVGYLESCIFLYVTTSTNFTLCHINILTVTNGFKNIIHANIKCLFV